MATINSTVIKSNNVFVSHRTCTILALAAKISVRWTCTLTYTQRQKLRCISSQKWSVIFFLEESTLLGQPNIDCISVFARVQNAFIYPLYFAFLTYSIIPTWNRQKPQIYENWGQNSVPIPTQMCAYFIPVDSYLITFIAFLVDQRQAVRIWVKMHQILKLDLEKTKLFK